MCLYKPYGSTGGSWTLACVLGWKVVATSSSDHLWNQCQISCGKFVLSLISEMKPGCRFWWLTKCTLNTQIFSISLKAQMCKVKIVFIGRFCIGMWTVGDIKEMARRCQSFASHVFDWRRRRKESEHGSFMHRGKSHDQWCCSHTFRNSQGQHVSLLSFF